MSDFQQPECIWWSPVQVRSEYYVLHTLNIFGTLDCNYVKKKVVGLERGPLSLVSTTEEPLDRKVAAPVAPFNRKSWQSLRRQAAVARSV
jgi:hypothetical protein